jgi:L-threonylcarbamoyladenylate synthase
MGNRLASSIQQQVEQGINVLKQGGIVAFPTDTVYGLGAAINGDQAVARVYMVKGRPRNMALPLLLADKSQIAEVAEAVPPIAWLLADKFLPGALTMVLLKSESVPDIITGSGKTVAIRIPAHPIPISLVRGLGTPIVGTSANLSGSPSTLTAEEVYTQLDDQVDLIINGGRCPGGKESTVIDLTGEIPLILREGAISREELKQVCPNVVFKEGG